MSKKKPRKKSATVDRVLTYPPPVIASILTLLTMNATEAGASFGAFDGPQGQLKSSVDFAAKLERDGVAGSETFRAAVTAVETFYKKDAVRKALVDDAHKAVAALITKLAADGDWGGCKFISQTRIKQIVQLP